MLLDVDLFVKPNSSEARALSDLPEIFLMPSLVWNWLEPEAICLGALVVCVLFLHGVGSSAQRCNKFKKN